MNDSIIIKAISKIYSKIVIFFLIFLLFCSAVIITLLHGFEIDHFQTSYVKIEKLYIKWDKQLIVSAKTVSFLSNQKKNIQREKPISLKSLLGTILNSYQLFQKIDIQSLSYKDLKLSIIYNNHDGGIITSTSKFSEIALRLFINSDQLLLRVKKFHYFPLNVVAKGNISFEKSKKYIESDLNITIDNQIFLRLLARYEDRILSYKATFNKPIKETKSLLQKLQLPKPVQYWAITAIEHQGVEITTCEGWIDIDDIKNSYKHLHLIAKANHLIYKYHPDIDPIVTDYTLLEFKNGTLFIRPKNPTTYGYNLQKSYLTIDFKPKKELLTLFLKFDDAKLDKNILHILATYGIDVPLIQKSGTTQTNLTLKVDLRDINVEAEGTFRVDEGLFYYLGMDISVKNVVMKLKNSHIKIHKMLASYKDIVSSYVDLDLKLSQHTGDIDFDILKLHPNSNISLAQRVQVNYHINKVGDDTISIPQTLWNLHDTQFAIEALKIPFSYKNLRMKLPLTKISSKENSIILFASGAIDLQKKDVNLDIDLTKFHYKEFELAQSGIYFKAHIHNNVFTLTSNKSAQFYYQNSEFYLGKINAQLQNNTLTLQKLSFDIPQMLHLVSDTTYDLQTNQGSTTFNYFRISTPSGDIIYDNSNPVTFFLMYENDTFKLSSKDIQTTLLLSQNGIKVLINSLASLLPYSMLLQKFKIIDGNLQIFNNTFQADFQSKYALFLLKNRVSNKYYISGSIKNSTVRVKINNKIIMTIDDAISIKANRIGLHLGEMQNLIEAHANKGKSGKNIYINLYNSYLFISEKRKIIFDTLKIQSIKGDTTAQMSYKNGNAGFRYNKKKFYLYGSNFNDSFMDNLFFQSKFQGGKLDFNIVGTFEDYKGIFEITNTTILDFKILNNILAFIDTVPSLVTFSLPKYSSEGLKVHKAYASFHYQNQIFDFDNISLESDQIHIAGKGKASYTKDFIDLVLQLKTNLANKASKIPVVGYILFDGKSISTTLRVHGKLEDPKVETQIAKDIAVAPLNIIKRTILYPVHLFGLDKE